MTGSLTVSVRPFVPFFSFSVFGVPSALGMSWKFQGCFKKVERTFQESFKGVSRNFNGCCKEVSRVFLGRFKGVSRKFQCCFEEVSGSFREVTWMFQESYKEN